jgi:hypothetical protein
MTDQFLGAPTANIALIMAVLSFVAAIGSPIVSIIALRREEPGIAVDLALGSFQWQGLAAASLMHLEAKDRGRRPVTLSSYRFELSDGTAFAFIPYPFAPMPKQLNEGEGTPTSTRFCRMQVGVREKPANVRVTALMFKSTDDREFRFKTTWKERFWHRWSRWPTHGNRVDWNKKFRYDEVAPESENLDLLDPPALAREQMRQIFGR